LEQVKLQTGSGVRLVFAVHAYRAGRLLLGPDGPSHVPYIIILGGTDVNEYQEDPVKAAVMALAVNGARKVVAFTVTMAELALRHWSTLTPEKVVTITQAVVTIPSTEYSLRRKFGLGQIRSSPPSPHPESVCDPRPLWFPLETNRILLLPCGIRAVKDPLFLLDAFAEWRKTETRIQLFVAGPALDPTLMAEFSARISAIEGVWYLGELNLADLHACIVQADVVLNSSRSEGLSNALLEAMQLGTVVLARNIPGNASLITQGETGFLYSSPQDCVRLAKQIVSLTPPHHTLNNTYSQNFVYSSFSPQQNLKSQRS